MRYTAAAGHLLPIDDETAADARDAERTIDLRLAREASPSPSLRRRAGEAVIAFGVRLAGDTSGRDERRAVARAT